MVIQVLKIQLVCLLLALLAVLCASNPTTNAKYQQFGADLEDDDDPCLRADCDFGQICVRSLDGYSFNCLNEKSSSIKEDSFQNYPTDYNRKYLSYSPCMSSPCGAKQVCRNLDETRYKCVNELSTTTSTQRRHQVGEARKTPSYQRLSAKNQATARHKTFFDFVKERSHTLRMKQDGLSSEDQKDNNAASEDAILDGPPSGEQISKNVQNLYKVAIHDNVQKAINNKKYRAPLMLKAKDASTNLKANKQARNPCSKNPCPSEKICQEMPSGNFKCLKKIKDDFNNDELKDFDGDFSSSSTHTTIQNEDNSESPQSLSDICEGKAKNEKIPDARNPRFFYVCKSNSTYQAMECMRRKVFDVEAGKCVDKEENFAVDKEQAALSDCLSNPCLYGAACSMVDGRHNCTCPLGYTGENCQEDAEADPCASNPCGKQPGAVCNKMRRNRYLTYYCTCQDGGMGSTCDDEAQPENPCSSEVSDGPFPTNLHPAVYVKCDLNKFEFEFVQCHARKANRECTSFSPLAF